MPFGARGANAVPNSTVNGHRYPDHSSAQLAAGQSPILSAYFSNFLREPFQMESHAGPLFVFLLLQPSGLFRQGNSPKR